MRIGTGFDVHAFCHNRKLILGGVEIPFEQGLMGHSDADVLTHAICDAILGALALGDLGEHFPDTDAQYRDADSLGLLSKVCELAWQNHYEIVNVDATLIAQAPRVSAYKQEMCAKLARVMQVPPDHVSVKATSTEHLGFTGRGEGMAAQAVALLKQT